MKITAEVNVMPDYFKERSTRTYRQKQLFSKEELEARESACVHEQPAFCAAACPMKLDVKEFVADMARGDPDSARLRLERVAPFPLILAHGCSGPCMAKCRLGELPGGQGADIPALERAAMAQGRASAGRLTVKFKKKKTAAIFGADLFTLALAGELERKSYPLTFFAAEGSAAELVAKCAPFLSPEDAAKETERLLAMDITMVYGQGLTSELLAEQRDGFHIVCAVRELAGEPDAVSLVTDGGVVTSSAAASSGALPALFDARRAAVSADRLAQGLDPGKARGEEGPVGSRLYTDMEAVGPSRRVPEGDGYTPEGAAAEAARCIQCKCDQCVRACVYLRHFKKFPRILTREIYNNVDIIMGDHMMNKAINACSLCGQCSVVCPNGYDVAEVCLRARENMVETDKLSLAVHEFALLDMLFSNGEAFLSRPQPGFEKCKYVFFPGCQAEAVAPETVRLAYLDLTRRLDGGVALMLGCCGAVARWAGRRGLHEEQTALLKSELSRLGDPIVIAGCPTCQTELRERLGADTAGVWDVLLDIGLPEGAASGRRRAVIHDSCAARGDGELRQSVRALAERLGCELKETEWSGDRTTCCGYGGLVSQANPQVAHEMAEFCLSQSEDMYVTYCMACRDRFAREGRESMHLLELCYATPPLPPPDISEKRRNRLALRQGLLKEIWGEDVLEKDMGFVLNITEEARDLMDRRMILETDVRDVLEGYRETGEAVSELDTGLLVARRRLGNVTFWVKFTQEGENEYTVRRAYSHRMTIETR